MQLVTSDIVQIGDPVLRKRAARVAKRDIKSPAMRELIVHMRRLLAAEKNGVGLAAPQVGVSLQLFIVAGRVFEECDDEDTERSPEPHPLDKVFINPELVRLSRKKKEMHEGCLSVRGAYGTVVRHEKASVKALDENGEPMTYHGSGLVAHIFQHEVDHLGGVLFVDKAITLEHEKVKEQTSNVKNAG